MHLQDYVHSCVVVGAGSIGQRHIQVLLSSGKTSVFAFPVREQTRLKLKAENINVLESWEQVKDLGISCAIIATDTGRHPVDIQSALEAGCQILVEKPMAVRAGVAFQNLQEAKHLDKNIWVGCSMRFHEALGSFREQLQLIGKIYSVRIECQSYLPDWRPQRPYRDSYSARSDEGGVLRDLIHEIDYAGWLYGWPHSVTAKIRATQILGIPSEDTADILWETQQGVLVSLTLDYLSRIARRQMRAFGEHGMLEWDGIEGRTTLDLFGGRSQEFHSNQVRDEIYLTQDQAFLDAASLSGLFDERLASGADGVRALAVCDACRESSVSRREVRVAYPEGL